MLVYDITDRDTFDNVNNWISEIRTYADSKVGVLLVGNKCDNEGDRKVTYEEGASLAAKMGCQFWEVSAKADINVSEAYHAIAVTTKNRYWCIMCQYISYIQIIEHSSRSSATLHLHTRRRGRQKVRLLLLVNTTCLYISA